MCPVKRTISFWGKCAYLADWPLAKRTKGQPLLVLANNQEQSKVILMMCGLGLLQHNWYSNSWMQQLLQDAETLPFKKGKQISLAILKKEISRRIVKIKSLLGSNSLPSHKSRFASCASQTQNLQPNRHIQLPPQSTQALSPKRSTINLPVEVYHKTGKYAGRCSLPVRKLNDKKVDENALRKSNRVRVSQYLLTAKANEGYMVKKIETSANKTAKQEFAQKEQDCSSNEFDFLNSFKNSKQKSQIYVQKSGYPLNIPLVFENMEEHNGLNQFDSEDSDLQYVRSGSAVRKSTPMKKIRFTERTALEQQKRLLISQDIMQKMSGEVSKLVVKKRREAQDNKLRENIFKKIEQKYGQYFDNI